MGKPDTATKTAKPKAKKRAPRLSKLTKEDYSLCLFGLEAFIIAEELKDIEFAEQHVVVDHGGGDGDKVPWKGTYGELVSLYKTYDRPIGSIARDKALALAEKIKALRAATKK